MRLRPLRLAPAILCMAAFWLVSDRPGDLVFPVAGGDKIAHGIAYAVLAAAIRWGIDGTGGTRSATWIAWLAAAAYGALDEWHQSWVPGRFATVGDWIADAVGAAVGAVAADRFLRTRGRRR